jgi:hypothetical protein
MDCRAEVDLDVNRSNDPVAPEKEIADPMQDDSSSRGGGLMKAPMLLALIALSISTAQAAEPTGTLTLACQGVTTNPLAPGSKEEPLSIRIIVDFAARTVDFGHQANFPAQITDLTETTIMFWASDSFDRTKVLMSTVEGSIDRMTGEVIADIFSQKKDGTECDAPGKRVCKGIKRYWLKCKPMQRMF